MGEWLTEAGTGLLAFLRDTPVVWAVLSGIICVDALALLVRTAVVTRKRDWDSGWFIGLCLAVFAWALCSFLHYGALCLPQGGTWLASAALPLRYVGYVFVPGLMCMHVWRQVRYVEPVWYVYAAYFAVPTVFAVWDIVLVLGAKNGAVPDVNTAFGYGWIVFFIYFAAMWLNSVLYVMSVFFGVPGHMRRPAKYMLAGVLAFGVAVVLQLLWRDVLPYDISLLAALVVLHVFYLALRVLTSKNVIVTSRELVQQNLSTVILVLNRKGQIVDWNTRGAAGLTHLPQPKYLEAFSAWRHRLMILGGRASTHGDGVVTFTHEGGEVHYLISAREVSNERRLLGYLVEISDVSKVYAVLHTLEENATIDQLTGLYNRNAYLQHVKRVVRPENMPLLLLVGDVNNLKPTNDVYGHLAGDTLLSNVAEIIKKNMPAGAFAGRIGGDEFVVLAPGYKELDAQGFIARACDACEKLPRIGGIVPGVSWGYAVMTGPGEDYNDVFSAADKMMYEQKRQYAKFRSSGLLPESEFVAGAPVKPPVPDEEAGEGGAAATTQAEAETAAPPVPEEKEAAREEKTPEATDSAVQDLLEKGVTAAGASEKPEKGKEKRKKFFKKK